MLKQWRETHRTHDNSCVESIQHANGQYFCLFRSATKEPTGNSPHFRRLAQEALATGEKVCSSCNGDPQPLSNFYLCNLALDGHRSVCKKCYNTNQTRRRKAKQERAAIVSETPASEPPSIQPALPPATRKERKESCYAAALELFLREKKLTQDDIEQMKDAHDLYLYEVTEIVQKVHEDTAGVVKFVPSRLKVRRSRPAPDAPPLESRHI